MNDVNTPGTTSPALTPAQRLDLSRERMRASLRESSASKRRTRSDASSSVVMTALRTVPGASVVIDAVLNWWNQHPLRTATLVAANTARSVVGPMARRNPYSMMFAAMLVGGALFWVRPWRKLLKPALLASLMPHLVSRVMAQVPVESWISAAVAAFQRPHTASTSPTEQHAPHPAAQPAANEAQASADATATRAGTGSSTH